MRARDKTFIYTHHYIIILTFRAASKHKTPLKLLLKNNNPKPIVYLTTVCELVT